MPKNAVVRVGKKLIIEQDCVGIDQGLLATEECYRTATSLLGQEPTFWGRYFKGPGNRMPIQYQADKEGAFFASHTIRVLPIARQTGNVCIADSGLGYADGMRNAAAILSAFGAVHLSQMTGVLVFLDVEPETPLSQAYYEGWSAGLIAAGRKDMVDFADEVKGHIVPQGPIVGFVPSVYGHHSDSETWSALTKAVDGGAPCDAAWVVYMDENPNFPIGPWKAKYTSPQMPQSVRVVLCQRILDFLDAKGREYDFDLANPKYKDWMLDRLVVPTSANIQN
jgi:hypothetical protein